MPTPIQEPPAPIATRWSKDRIGGLLLLAFCSTYAWQTRHIAIFRSGVDADQDGAFNARSLPTFLAIIGVGLALALILRPAASSGPAQFGGYRWGRFVGFLLLMSAYGLTIRPLGFVLATMLFLLAGFVTLGERRVLPLIAVAGGIAVGFWALMDLGLGVFIEPLPHWLRTE